MMYKMRGRSAVAYALVCALSITLSSCSGSGGTMPQIPGQSSQTVQSAQSLGLQSERHVGDADDLRHIKHFVVIYQENWSFDALYAEIPGANGYGPGRNAYQVDKSGNPLASIPQPLDYNGNPDPRFPASLPDQTYDLAPYVPPSGTTGDLIHRFYHEQLQIDGGTMDKFVTWSDNGGLTLSEYDASSLPEGLLAQKYTIADNFFHSAFGGSFLNHQFLICACAPPWPGAPPSYISNPDPNNLNDNHVTPDGYAVNTSYSTYSPHPAGIPAADLVPPQTNPTIGDRLSDAGVSWKWYSGGWNNAIAGNPDPLFQFHHQPFAYYKNYADGTAARQAHLRDETEFFTDVQNGTLPDVVFIKPIGAGNEHPGYTSLLEGQQHVQLLVQTIRHSKYWHDTAIIITYDENGGRWDHVGPPKVDRWGPGSRVPAVVVSHFARKHYVDHTQYETLSIIRTLELRYGLKPLTSRDELAAPMLNAFDFRDHDDRDDPE